MQPTNIKVYFEDPGPIRMASEYNIANKVEVRGLVNLDFPFGFQDIFAEDRARHFIYLVDWSIDDNNEPGFFVLKIDPKQEKIVFSQRIEGCCDEIEATEFGVRVVSLQYPDGTPASRRYQPIDVRSFPNEYKKHKII